MMILLLKLALQIISPPSSLKYIGLCERQDSFRKHQPTNCGKKTATPSVNRAFHPLPLRPRRKPDCKGTAVYSLPRQSLALFDQNCYYLRVLRKITTLETVRPRRDRCDNKAGSLPLPLVCDCTRHACLPQ